jgi:small-conductance mechanosensitive channel
MIEWLTDYPNIIHEIISIIVVIGGAYLLNASILRKLNDQKEKSRLNETLQKIISPIIGNCIAIVLLAIDAAVTNLLYQSNEIVTGALQLTIIITISRVAQLFSKSKTVFWLAFLIQGAHHILFKFELIEETIHLMDQYSLNLGPLHLTPSFVIKTVTTIMLLIWIASAVSQGVKLSIKNMKGVKSTNKILLNKVSELAIYIISGLVIMHSLGINITTLAVFSGAIGVGVGFGLQKIASNYISGIILLLEKSVEVGDIIEIGTTPAGTVKHIGGRYTLVETPDCREILVPNEDFVTNRVANWTYTTPMARVEIQIAVEYGSDLDKVKQQLLEAAESHPRSLKNPAPTVFLKEFGTVAINFSLYFFVQDVQEGKMNAQSEVLFDIWRRFKKEGIEFAYQDSSKIRP